MNHIDRHTFPDILKYLSINDIKNVVMINKHTSNIIHLNGGLFKILIDKLLIENNIDKNKLQDLFQKKNNKQIFQQLNDLIFLTEWEPIKKKNLDVVELWRTSDLFFANCELHGVPKELGSLENLKELSFKNTKLTEIPKELGNLINLKELFFEYTKLTEIPKELGNLINLKRLYLYDDNLLELPKELGNLVNLRRLGFSGEIKEIPQEFYNLANLGGLRITHLKNKKLYCEAMNLITSLSCCELTNISGSF